MLRSKGCYLLDGLLDFHVTTNGFDPLTPTSGTELYRRFPTELKERGGRGIGLAEVSHDFLETLKARKVFYVLLEYVQDRQIESV